MKLWKKLKLTYRYFRSLDNKKESQKTSDLTVRPDVYAFLTCPYPVLPEEKRHAPK